MIDKTRLREQRFVEEYVVDFNGTRAAIRAGYAPKSAKVTASRLLTRANVADAITATIAARQERTEVTADQVVRDIAFAAKLEVFTFFDAKMRLRSPDEIPPAARACVESIKPVMTKRVRYEKTKQGRRRRVVEQVLGYEIKLVSKSRMYELLARHVGIYQGEGAPAVPPPPAFALPASTPGIPVH